MIFFFFSPICLHVFFFRRESSARFFFLDRTSLNIKGIQSSAQFNYSTAQGDTLFGVSIFAKFEYHDYRERNELLDVLHLMTRGVFFSLVKETLLRRVGRCHSLITVELKSEKREKFKGNIVRILNLKKMSVLFSRSKIKTSCPIDKWIVLQRVHKAYDNFHSNNPAIPTRYLRETLTLILNENYFQFNGRNYLQIHGTAMGTKMAVAFANIFMADIETQIVSQSVAVKPTVWKRYIDDIFTLWDTSNLHDIERFIEQANSYNPTIKFMAEISNADTTFPAG